MGLQMERNTLDHQQKIIETCYSLRNDANSLQCARNVELSKYVTVAYVSIALWDFHLDFPRHLAERTLLEVCPASIYQASLEIK
jgi:hypothetical protein